MNITSIGRSATTLVLAVFCFMGSANAVPVLCKEASTANRVMDAAEVASCLGADVHDVKDEILSVDARRNEILIDTDFVSSAQIDRWFVYFLNPLLHSGEWRFAKLMDRDGRLAHIKLYGQTRPKNVPEPGTLALLAAGLLGVGIARRRKRS